MAQHAGPLALTQLGEDERMFQSTVDSSQRNRSLPWSARWTRPSRWTPALIKQLFALGLMGIEVPEEYGGAGGTFFEAILAVEAISAVDPAVGVLVDVQNTLCINALHPLGHRRAEDSSTCPRLAKDTDRRLCAQRSRAPAPTPSRCRPAPSSVATTTSSTGRSSGSPTPKRPASSSSSPRSIPPPATRASPPSSSRKDAAGFTSARRKTSSASAPPAPASSSSTTASSRASHVLGEPGKGYKIAIETLNEGRIGIGAQMLGLAAGRLGTRRADGPRSASSSASPSSSSRPCSSSSPRWPPRSKPRA